MDPCELIDTITEEFCKVVENTIQFYKESAKEFENLISLKNNFTENVMEKIEMLQKDTQQIIVENQLYDNKINDEKNLIKLEKNEVDNLKCNLATLEKELQRVYEETEATKRKGEPLPKDEQMFKKAELKFMLLKEIFPVRFDYAVPEKQVIKGYIRDKSSTRVKSFKYDARSIPHADITEKLWDLLSSLILKEDSE